MTARRQVSLDCFRRRVAFWIERLRVQPARVAVMDMTRKWASCSASGRVTFATAAASLPARLRDYVIVHELLHLRVRNHGRLFKAHLTACMPDWPQRHRRLPDRDRRGCPQRCSPPRA